ncbi:MAG TPA: zinc-binding dehydrogenase [Acidimicrobiales bacterium]|jgi:NADPH2:quinone reductase
MKAAVYYENGGPEVLRYEEVPDPTPGPGEILLRAKAIGIQGGDTLNRLKGELTSVPHIVGYQSAGDVIAVGEGVTKFAVGDRVVSLGLNGSHAELRATHESFCWSIPEGVSYEDAACVPTEFGTASDTLFEFGRLVAGETVLIHAGASGVGIAAIQLAKRAGAIVLATASSDERLERLRGFGLDHGINYTTSDFVEAARALTDGRGVNVIVDGVGGPTLQKSFHALAYRGRIVSFGNAGRDEATTLDISSMNGNNQSFTDYFLGIEIFLSSRPHDIIAKALEDIANGELRIVIDRRYPLSEAADAHEYVESRHALGRVVLIA